MANELGKVRRSMLTMMYCPGAIVDFRADGGPVSAIVAGLEEWDNSFPPRGLENEQTIREYRLEEELNVKGFRLPPIVSESDKKNKNKSLTAFRFPDWLQCPVCDRIAPSHQWGDEQTKAYLYCPDCSNKRGGGKNDRVFVVPVRFVLACKKGHLDDFPWHYYLGHEKNCKRNNDFLLLRSIKPGLSGLILSCPECGVSRSLNGIFTESVIKKNGIKCWGNRPWLGPEDSEECSEIPRVLQRGASNLYYPVVRSAISIPPWNDPFFSILGPFVDKIGRKEPSEKRLAYIRMIWDDEDFICRHRELGYDIERFFEEFEKKYKRISDKKSLGIEEEEYLQFTSAGTTSIENSSEFEIRSVNILPTLKTFFSSIVRVVRLREVRALCGFTRIQPPADKDSAIVRLSKKSDFNWLPAIEVRGEGIFLDFNKTTLKSWELNSSLQKRAEEADRSWRAEWCENHPSDDLKFHITPRFLLIHSFSHALMRELSMECGYSSAALRERLYISEGDEGMSGVLIYTSTTDSDGSLGGLQRLGEEKRIEHSFVSAIRAMEWCSSDPLCIQGMVSGRESHSPAACHSCLLAPETSCEHFNQFLDRATLVGLPESSIVGYFAKILED